MPRGADPSITDAFAPLVQHLAYDFEVDPQLDRVARVHSWLGEAGPALRAALREAGALDAEVQLLDLHGMRAAEARAALRTCTEPICVVWFGKGKGVLRAVFLEHIEREGGFFVVDLAGETRERPQEAMGLVLREDLHERLVEALHPGAGRPPRPAPRGAPPAPPLPRRSSGAGAAPAGPSRAQQGALQWLLRQLLRLIKAMFSSRR